jgi:hypothetical protein
VTDSIEKETKISEAIYHPNLIVYPIPEPPTPPTPPPEEKVQTPQPMEIYESVPPILEIFVSFSMESVTQSGVTILIFSSCFKAVSYFACKNILENEMFSRDWTKVHLKKMLFLH